MTNKRAHWAREHKLRGNCRWTGDDAIVYLNVVEPLGYLPVDHESGKGCRQFEVITTRYFDRAGFPALRSTLTYRWAHEARAAYRDAVHQIHTEETL